MSCCQCQGIENIFNQKVATDELRNYRKKGAAKTSRMLLDALKERGVAGSTLLDIGGGVGAIQHGLLQAGASQAIHVDASRSFLQAARQEAERRGLDGQISFHHGDYVKLAGDLPPADIVTLDRVICCYDDMPALVNASTEKARRLYGVVYPRDGLWMKLFQRVANVFLWLRKNPFRLFIHPGEKIEALIIEKGFRRIIYQKTLIWQVAVYARDS